MNKPHRVVEILWEFKKSNSRCQPIDRGLSVEYLTLRHDPEILAQVGGRSAIDRCDEEYKKGARWRDGDFEIDSDPTLSSFDVG